MRYLIYFTNTGKIKNTGNIPLNNIHECLELNCIDWKESNGTDVDYIVDVDYSINSNNSYVDISTIEVKERMPLNAILNKTSILADDVDEIILSNLPIPCDVYLDGQIVEITDGSFEFSTPDVGYYKLKIDHVAYLKEEWEIEAT